MNQIKISTVAMILLVALVGIGLVVLGINYFDIEPGGITQPAGEISLGATSKLGWILTFGFVCLYSLFSLLRRLYYKITGRF